MELANGAIEIWCSHLQRDSDEIDLGILRIIIRTFHKIETNYKNESELESYASEFVCAATKLSDTLKAHLMSNKSTIEGHTLIATAYCAVFVILPAQFCEICLRNLNTSLACHFLRQEGQMANNLTNALITKNDLNNRKMETKITTLISGIFQTNLLNKSHLPEDSRIRQLSENIMIISFKITIKACLTYSNSTFIHFRNLHSIVSKMIDWKCCDKIIGDTKNVLLFVIFNNWENLLSGIREINVKIWKLFLSLINKNSAENTVLFAGITDCIFQFPWNKAKYFVLCEIIPHLKYDILDFLIDHPTCISGLEYSLKHSSLVSAGSDMYKTLLREFKSFNEWINAFFMLFKNILCAEKSTAQCNLLNHWMPATIKKYPMLIECLTDYFFSKDTKPVELFPVLSVLKLGRKFGLILTDWNAAHEKNIDFKNMIEIGLADIDDEVRSQAFQTVCLTQKTSIPTKDEFDKVKSFLELNINSDSTSFRQNNLSCFTTFLIRIRDSFLNLLKDSEKNLQSLNEIGDFFIWVHDFLIKNFDSQGNYQRKILSLQIYDVILRYFCGGSSDKQNIQKSLCRKGNQRDQGWKVVEYLRIHDKWKFASAYSVKKLIECINDSTNDIREIAVDILIQYFSNDKVLKKSLNTFFVNGIILCNSKMFYEAECGCLMFKIIANFNKGSMRSHDYIKDIIYPFTIYQFLLNKAWEQFTFQESDLLLSIYNDQPLHGMISAIDMYTRYSGEKMSYNYLIQIKNFLTSVTNNFINVLACKSVSSNAEVPPSFAEMGESIEYIIASSELKEDEYEITQHLSNAHQLLLNNIWLNLKACCDLSSTVISQQYDDLKATDIKELLNISISVLTRCRHKGAIESAGVALGRSVKHLTSLGSQIYKKMISNMLKEFLTQSTLDSIQGVSITRKSAGLSILVHRIVSNDSQDGKPLFYMTMDVLLRVLSAPEKILYPAGTSTQNEEGQSQSSTPTVNTTEDFSNEKDVPLARALHLLCRTVYESSLASYVIQFTSQLVTVCFNHLTSEQWQVRNAALQLYGALVPKLIGQKRSQTEDTLVKSPMSPDELFSHVPSLWNYIKTSLREASQTNVSANVLLSHSNIVPILSLLSSMAKRYNMNSFCSEQCKELGINVANLEDIFPDLIILIGSPIYNIRNISANIVASLFDVIFFVDHWNSRKDSPLKENELHGYLLILKQYVTYFISFKKYLFNYEQDEKFSQMLKTVLSDLNNIINGKISSFIVKALHLEIAQMLNEERKDYCKSIEDAFQTIESYGANIKLQIGIHHWLQLNVSHAIMNCEEYELLIILQKCIASNSSILMDTDFWSTAKDRIEKSLCSSEINFHEIFEYLINLTCDKKKRVNKIVYEILYSISSKCSTIMYCGLLGKIYCNLNIEENMDSYQGGYLLPLVCSMSCEKDILNSNASVHLELSKICKALSKPERFEAANRKMAAVSMKHLAKLLKYYREKKNTDDKVNEIKCNVLIASLWLLQDEDTDVRTECAKMCLNDEKENIRVHPNIHINTILNLHFHFKLFCGFAPSVKQFLKILLKELNLTDEKKVSKDLQNPFDHNTPNIYWEPKLIHKYVSIIYKDFNQKYSKIVYNPENV